MRTVYKAFLGVFFVVILAGCDQPREAVKVDSLKAVDPGQVNPRVKLETTMGDIVLELDTSKAPVTVDNFVRYVQDGFYDGLIFHRVIPGFMVQGGGMKPDMSQVETRPAIKNESSNGLSNQRGSIAMARTNAPDSATAQFFINEVDNTFLDAKPGKPGYAVFGRVVEGMDVVDAMSKVKTSRHGPHGDVPEKNIVISKAELINKKRPGGATGG